MKYETYGSISSSEELIMSADNINVCRTEGHGNIDHGVDENHLGEKIIFNNQQSFNNQQLILIIKFLIISKF